MKYCSAWIVPGDAVILPKEPGGQFHIPLPEGFEVRLDDQCSQVSNNFRF
jgi:hypothetical protein